jgi:large subunit ribosomal protein L29
MKAMEVRELEDAELAGRLAETQRELFNLRFQAVTGRLDNYARLGQLKRDVARIRTVLREREIARAEGRLEDAVPVPAVRRAEAESSGASGKKGQSRSGQGGDVDDEAEEAGDYE